MVPHDHWRLKRFLLVVSSWILAHCLPLEGFDPENWDKCLLSADSADSSILDSAKLYEIKPSLGKGLGVFAVQDIERGTRITCEEPLIHLPGGDIFEVMAAFAKLPPDRRAVFLSLHCRPLGGIIDKKREMLLKAHPLMSLRAAALTVPIEEQLQVMAIHETNCFEAKEGSVICVEASRINHSCLPNVQTCWNVTIGAETVHAVKNIAKGEEIFTTYIPRCEARAQRGQRLVRYGFKCSCSACEASTVFGKESERRCKRLFHIDQALAMHSQIAVFSPFHHGTSIACCPGVRPITQRKKVLTTWN